MDDVTQVGEPPPDASASETSTTPPDATVEDVTQPPPVDAGDAGDAGDPLCDLVADTPDGGDAGDAGDAGTTYSLKCSVKMKDVSTVSWTNVVDTNAICALSEAGDVYCWGANRFGAVGRQIAGDGGIGVNVATPVKVLSGVAQLQVSDYTSAAVKTTGEVFFWGITNTNQGGTQTGAGVGCEGNAPCFDSPHQVVIPNDGGALPPMVKVAVGEQSSCAIEKTGGGLWCWGTRPGTNVVYFERMVADAGAASIPTPVKDVGVGSSGGPHQCAIGGDDAVYCWGLELRGRVGSNSADNTIIPVTSPQKIAGLPSGAAQLSVNRDNTCALLLNGEVWCWGSNGQAQLGQGTADSNAHPAPVKVPGLPADVAIIDGRNFAHFVTTKSGSVLAWGMNSSYSFGDGFVPVTTCEGSNPCQKVPRVIGNFPPMLHVAGSVGVAKDGRVYTWGGNNRNWLGHLAGTNGDTICLTGDNCNTVATKLLVLP